jgi:hypothetical protein
MTTDGERELVCASCGRSRPSLYYFAAPRLCTDCYAQLPPGEQRRADEVRAAQVAQEAAAASKRRASALAFYWPRVATVAEAKKAARLGFWAAVVCGASALASSLFDFSHLAPRATPHLVHLYDAAVYCWVAIGLFHYSRVAAIAGLGVYALAQVLAYVRHGGPPWGSFATVMVMIVLSFVNGVRGTWAYRRLLRG